MTTMSIRQYNHKKILVIYLDKYLTVNRVWPLQVQTEKNGDIQYQRGVINLKEVRYADSSGLGLLLSLLKQLEVKGCQLVLCECSPYMLDLINRLRLGELFRVYEKEGDACRWEDDDKNTLDVPAVSDTRGFFVTPRNPTHLQPTDFSASIPWKPQRTYQDITPMNTAT